MKQPHGTDANSPSIPTRSNSTTSSSSHPELIGQGTTTESPSRDRLRAAAQALKARGVQDADEALRLGAAAMAERCIARFDDGEYRPGWLFEAVRQGGAWVPLRETSEYQQARAESSEALRERAAQLGIRL